jgi:hypothetical protein
MTMLQRIKLLLNISDSSKDALLEELIENAEEYVATYCNNADAVTSLPSAIIQMVIQDYNRMGAEGLNSESYSGVSFNYQATYSEDIMKQLRRYRKIGVIRHDD